MKNVEIINVSDKLAAFINRFKDYDFETVILAEEEKGKQTYVTFTLTLKTNSILEKFNTGDC